jgi:hypothetical protein
LVPFWFRLVVWSTHDDPGNHLQATAGRSSGAASAAASGTHKEVMSHLSTAIPRGYVDWVAEDAIPGPGYGVAYGAGDFKARLWAPGLALAGASAHRAEPGDDLRVYFPPGQVTLANGLTGGESVGPGEELALLPDSTWGKWTPGEPIAARAAIAADDTTELVGVLESSAIADSVDSVANPDNISLAEIGAPTVPEPGRLVIQAGANGSIYALESGGSVKQLHQEAFAELVATPVDDFAQAVPTPNVSTIFNVWERAEVEDQFGHVTADPISGLITFNVIVPALIVMDYDVSATGGTDRDFFVTAEITPATPVHITGVTNASPPVVTAVAHGRHSGDLIVTSGILGATGANGTWIVANPTADTLELRTTEAPTQDAPAPGVFAGVDEGIIERFAPGKLKVAVTVSGSVPSPLSKTQTYTFQPGDKLGMYSVRRGSGSGLIVYSLSIGAGAV